MKGSRTHLCNQAEYADEKHYEKPQPARWDHRVNLENEHAGMSTKWVIRNEASKGAERTLPWKSIHIAKRRKTEHEEHAPAFQSRGGACLWEQEDERGRLGGRLLDSQLPVPPRTPIRPAL